MTIEAAPFDFALNEMRRAGILEDLFEFEPIEAWIAAALEAACKVLTPASAPDLCRRVRYQLGKHYRRTGKVAAAAAAFAVAAEAARRLTELGKPPSVLTAACHLGAERAARIFEETYDDYRRRVGVLYR